MYSFGRFLARSAVPALLLLVSGAGCSGQDGSEEPVAVSPDAFDLKLPADFFVADGRGLPSNPGITDCHTQSITIVGADLILACVLYDPGASDQRTHLGRSYLLKAPLCEVVGDVAGEAAGCSGPPAAVVSWSIEEITGQAPEADSQRITRMLLKKEELTPEELAIRHLTSHPAGLVYDPDRDGVWVTNAVYASDSYSTLLLIRPEAIGQGNPAALIAREIPVSDHIGALSLIQGRYLVGLSWSSRRIIIVDLDSDHEPVSIDNPLLGSEHEVAIQDCDRWSATTILCGGTYRYDASPDMPDVPLSEDELADPERETVFVRRGRLQQLRIDVDRFPDVEVHPAGYLEAALFLDAPPTIDFGRRMIRTDPSGEQQDLVMNNYGGHRTPLALPNEAMTLDPTMQHVYFVPEDIPAGKLIHMAVLPP